MIPFARLDRCPRCRAVPDSLRCCSPSPSSCRRCPDGPRPPATPAPSSYATRADVRAFIEQMADEHGFDRAALRRAFARVHYQREIVAAMERPLLEPPKWYDYARSFLAPERVAAGVAYWNAHAGELARAEERYGVPPAIVVAILGVETFYGRNTGKYRDARCARDAGVRLPAPLGVLSRRAEAIPAARARARHVPACAERIVRRRDGRTAVHAGKLSQLRRRLRRQRPRGPVEEPGRHRRQRRELPRAGTTGSGASRSSSRRPSRTRAATKSCAGSTAVSPSAARLTHGRPMASR